MTSAIWPVAHSDGGCAPRLQFRVAVRTAVFVVVMLLLSGCTDDDEGNEQGVDGEASGAVESDWWEVDAPLAMEDAVAIAEDAVAPYDHRSWTVYMNVAERLDMVRDASILSCLSLRGVDLDGVTPSPAREVARGEWWAMNNTQFPDIELIAERGTRMAAVDEPGNAGEGYVLSNGEEVADAQEQDVVFCSEQVDQTSDWRTLRDVRDEVLAQWGQVLDEVDVDPDLDNERLAYRECLEEAGVSADVEEGGGPISSEFGAYLSWVTNESLDAASPQEANAISARYGQAWGECAEDLVAQVYERRAEQRPDVLDEHSEQIEQFARGVFVDVLEDPGPETEAAPPDGAAPLWEQDLSEIPEDELESLLQHEAAERAGLTEEDFQTQDWVNLPEVQSEYEALLEEVEETGTITPP